MRSKPTAEKLNYLTQSFTIFQLRFISAKIPDLKIIRDGERRLIKRKENKNT